jgi:hypothetical protein
MNITNVTYIKLNANKVITTFLVLICTIYLVPIGDYLFFSLKYLPGFYSEADTTRNTVRFSSFVIPRSRHGSLLTIQIL